MQLKVLYLDDEPDLCEIFSQEFSSANFTVLTFTNTEKALAAVKSDPPDLAFIDYRLPLMNGDQVAQAMPTSIPKYLVTGESSVTTKYKFMGVISKPYDLAVIREVLSSHLNKKKAA